MMWLEDHVLCFAVIFMKTNAHEGELPYNTLTNHATEELIVERSRFIAHALPIESVEDGEAFVADLKREHYDARHVCYGLRVGRGAQGVDRSNDDGEPARTGGFPLWQLLDGEDVIDAIIAVVRYFGGVKLGMGGLARAYRDAGRAAMDAAIIETRHPEHILTLPLAYDMLDRVNHLLAQLEGVRVVDTAYTDKVSLSLGVRKVELANVRQRLGVLLQLDPQDVGELE